MAAICASEVSPSKNPFQPWLSLCFDLSPEGGKRKMNFSSPGSIEDHKKIQLSEDCIWQSRQNFPLWHWPCATSRAHWISDLSCVWQRAEPVDRWRSSSPSSANYFCPGPTVPVKKPSMLSVTLSPLYHLSFPLSLLSSPSISIPPQSLS